jgi:hypothetical protein
MSNIRPVHVSQGLAGTERYGFTSNIEQDRAMPTFAQPGTQLAPPSGTPYIPKYNSCAVIREDNARCKGPKAKGTEYCIGHLRAMEKAAKAAEEKPSE